MAILSKDAILAADDVVFQDVEVPEWGGTVRIRALTGTERDGFEESVLRRSPDGSFEAVMADMRAKLLVRTLVDEDGKRLFSAKEVAQLGSKSAQVLDRLFEIASRLSGISRKDVDELAKNSEGVQSGDSGSD